MTSSHEELRYICFHLGSEEYAIPLLDVREVVAIPDITPVPQTPPYFLGIMNLRGQVISVIDLRVKLGMKPNQTKESAIIICDLGERSIGVVVDSINYVITIQEKDRAEKPEIHTQKNSQYITGVFRHKEKLILLLDIAQALNWNDQVLIQKASHSKEKISNAA